jgi:hypothetical protein
LHQGADDASAHPWDALLQIGSQLADVLRAASNVQAGTQAGTRTGTHPWLERDPQSGAFSLRLPLPPAQTAQRLAAAFEMISDSLRAMRSEK